MKASNIFKMEMYKNFRDVSWLIVIGALTAWGIITTLLGIGIMSSLRNPGSSSTAAALVGVTLFLLIFGGLAFWAFTIIYPYHLLSTDYSNKSLGLMVASGVRRTSYYFVKILATILSYLLALFVILIIPLILLLGFYQQDFVNFIAQFLKNIDFGILIGFLFQQLIGSLAAVVLLFYVAVLTRGKFWGVFVYLGISMGVGVLSSLFHSSLYGYTGGSSFSASLVGSETVSIVVAILQIIIFGLVGIMTIRKQDL